MTWWPLKLDRLARSSRDLHNILHELQEKGCGFVSLGESWCDTTTDVGRLVMTIMGGIAEFERNLIRKRCEDGIRGQSEKGTKFGRPTALDPGQRAHRRTLRCRRDHGRSGARIRVRRSDDLAGAAIAGGQSWRTAEPHDLNLMLATNSNPEDLKA